ncbi:MAG: hypothetical protein WCJ64_15600 [Rhodospirillaceae bacterium]
MALKGAGYDVVACSFTQATYLSIQACRKDLLAGPMPPASSNNPFFIWMNAVRFL